MNKNDIKRAHLYMYVRSKLNPYADKVFATLIPGGDVQAGLYLCGGLHGGKGHGCVTDLESGIGYDLGTQICWGDYIDLGRHLWGCMAEESALRIAEMFDLDIEDFERELHSKKSDELAREIPIKERVYPPPPVCPPAPTRLFSMGEIERIWRYTNINGRTLYYVADFPRGNSGNRARCFYTLHRKINGRLQWFRGNPPAPHQLYNLHAIHNAIPTAPILIVRGETAVHLAEELFPGVIATTWPPVLKRLDVTPLQNKKVFVWPEASLRGCGAALILCDKLLQLGNSPTVLNPLGIFPEGWNFGEQTVDGLPYQILPQKLTHCSPQKFSRLACSRYPELAVRVPSGSS